MKVDELNKRIKECKKRILFVVKNLKTEIMLVNIKERRDNIYWFFREGIG